MASVTPARLAEYERRARRGDSRMASWLERAAECAYVAAHPWSDGGAKRRAIWASWLHGEPTMAGVAMSCGTSPTYVRVVLLGLRRALLRSTRAPVIAGKPTAWRRHAWLFSGEVLP